MSKTPIKEKTLPLRIKVKPLHRDCRGCVIRGQKLCTWCASLVRDECGKVYVALQPLNGEQWQSVDISGLTLPPRSLLAE